MSDMEEIREILKEQQEKHIEIYHAFKADELKEMVVEHAALVKAVPENKLLLERVVEALDGKPEYDLHGKQTGRKGGMVSKQNMIERDVASIKYDANGGRGFSVRTRDKIIIGVIAALPSIAILIAAIVRDGNV